MLYVMPLIVDTCSLRNETKVIVDALSDCETEFEVTVNYCAGSCGESRYVPLLMVVADATESAEVNCKCCTGIPGQVEAVPIVCGADRVKQTAYIQTIQACQCDACVKTSMYTLFLYHTILGSYDGMHGRTYYAH